MPRFQLAQHVAALFQLATGQVPVVAAGPADGGAQQKAWWEIVGILVTTFLILGGGLYVMLNGAYGESAEKWASAVTGAVIGYWLK